MPIHTPSAEGTDVVEALEAEAIHSLREAAAEFARPVLLYSIGKDSSVLLELARRAFAPGPIPFPLLHIDTGFKFREMIEFRDAHVARIGARLIVRRNQEPAAQGMGPDQAHTDEYVYLKKTRPLLEALAEFGFDCAIGGARREEEKSRAKERIFSPRGPRGTWAPRNQRAELWHLYNARLGAGESMRVFPLSNWTEIDVWRYIAFRNVDVVPLYFAERRQVVRRHGVWLRLDEFVQARPGETVTEMVCRYRTLGCSPSTGAVASTARSVDEIVDELVRSRVSERQTRAIDHGSPTAMEHKKIEGYF